MIYVSGASMLPLPAIMDNAPREKGVPRFSTSPYGVVDLAIGRVCDQVTRGENPMFSGCLIIFVSVIATADIRRHNFKSIVSHGMITKTLV
ncbi:MAG: hypothetical protein B7Z63_02915 [Ignavibacteriae bacterium 37-53-5]|nr:MAG: hypothetical protein B7Z63_02915 [Ignavibacteriae bacterium 37-53-5]